MFSGPYLENTTYYVVPNTTNFGGGSESTDNYPYSIVSNTCGATVAVNPAGGVAITFGSTAGSLAINIGIQWYGWGSTTVEFVASTSYPAITVNSITLYTNSGCTVPAGLSLGSNTTYYAKLLELVVMIV